MKLNHMKVLTMTRTIGGFDGKMNVSGFIVSALITIATIVIVESAVIREDGCKLSINFANGDLKEPQPLILNYGKEATSFLHPIDEIGTVELKTGQPILIACPGKGNYIEGIEGLKKSDEIEANCLRDKTLTVASSLHFNFTNVACKFLPVHETRRTKKFCYANASHVEIGFTLKREFLRTIEVCRDDETMMTHWTKFRLTTRIDGFQSSFPRPSKWQAGDFYGKYNIDYQYRINTQIGTIEKQLGSRELANKFIDASKKRYMSRGHLTAKADFVYGSAQMTTFWYINAAPQWQTFNGGNWNTLEYNVRQFAAKRNSDIDVYTGTHEQMSINDINGDKVPIYLYANGTKRAFPVPKFYWKIIHDPLTKRATSFVGSNDPWAENITEDMFICDDISKKIKWLTWKAKSIVKGVSYACKVDDLRKAVPSIPLISVDDILV